MTLIPVVYCTESDIERLFSLDGITSFADHDQDGDSDAGVVDDCINEAAQEIELYCRQRYTQASLQASTLINRWATALATLFLCERRGNPPPESLHAKVTRIYERLQAILEGTMSLPGLALNGGQRPAFSNLTIDRRHTRNKVRRTASNSSNQSSAVDRHDAWEIDDV